MKKTTSNTLRTLALASLAACSLGIGSHAWAANHALIMTIDYAGTPNALPGIDKDGDIAFKIAEGMGVPRANIKRMSNRDLTLGGMSSALNDLVQNRIADGDKVFLYYSGHGYQRAGNGSGAKCMEALVTADEMMFEDEKLQQSLDRLAAKASQVVMFNDSCFSGGAATKDVSRSTDDAVAKVFVDVKAVSSTDTDYICGSASNKDFGSRTLGVVARQRPTQILYVAASADCEVSRDSRNGSWGTLAWQHCLTNKASDLDRNGFVDGSELRQCSQAFINSNFNKQQTITLIGNQKLMMSFAGNGSSGGASVPVTNARGTLETLQAAADPGIKVGLSIAKPRLTIGRDLLDFSVTTQRDGYLHLLHVASDGKFIVLFPNKLDTNNYIKAGTHRFPRTTWGIQAQGPSGTSYVMAYLADAPKDFTKDLVSDGPFAEGEANGETARKLGIVALNGRYGASAVAAIQEVN
jgi:hypothetical protein